MAIFAAFAIGTVGAQGGLPSALRHVHGTGRHSLSDGSHPAAGLDAHWEARAHLLIEAGAPSGWRPLDGAGATEWEASSLPGVEPVARPGAAFRSLAGHWARPADWVDSIGELRRNGWSLLPASSGSPMAITLGWNRHGVPGIYLVQNFKH